MVLQARSTRWRCTSSTGFTPQPYQVRDTAELVRHVMCAQHVTCIMLSALQGSYCQVGHHKQREADSIMLTCSRVTINLRVLPPLAVAAGCGTGGCATVVGIMFEFAEDPDTSDKTNEFLETIFSVMPSREGVSRPSRNR